MNETNIAGFPGLFLQIWVYLWTSYSLELNKTCYCFHCFPVYLTWRVGTRFHDLSFLNVEFFSSPLSLSSRGSLDLLHFLPQGWCHLHIWGYWHFSWQSWLCLCFSQPGISYDVLCIWVKQAGWQYTALMYSFPNFEPVHCSMSGSNSCFLICIQISQEAGQVVWYSHILKNFPQFVVINTVKDFGI